MAYFDSPKNRVMWEVELGKLRKEKEDFASGKRKDTMEKARVSRAAEASHRKPVTLEQLEKEEAMESGRKKDRKAEMNKRKERDISKDRTKSSEAKAKERPAPSLQKKPPVKKG